MGFPTSRLLPALAHAFLPAPGPTPIRTSARVPAHVRPLCLTCASAHVHPRGTRAHAPTHARTLLSQRTPTHRRQHRAVGVSAMIISDLIVVFGKGIQSQRIHGIAWD